MPKFILRFFALSILCAGAAFGQGSQGTFGQIVFGGPWQTTFTLINMSSTNPANVTLSFFGDGGAPLIAPVQGSAGSTNTAVYTLTIPAGGTQSFVLPSSLPTDPTMQGWATMSTTGTVRGQGSFRFQLPSGTISEAVVPLTLPSSALCVILPLPTNQILIPFDDTTGQYATSLAFANTTAAPQSYNIEFYNQSGNTQLIADTLTLPAMGHNAFLTTESYPALKGQKGLIRIHADPATLATLTVLGLLSNSTGAITTIIPVNQ